MNMYNFKIILRTFQKNYQFILINLLGLILGMTGSILIFAYIIHEKSFDKFEENNDQIYRVMLDAKFATTELNIAGTPPILASKLLNKFSEVKKAARIYKLEKPKLKINNTIYTEEMIFAADSSLFDIFSIEFLEGSAEKVLSRPYTAIITLEMVKKYFSNQDPLGQVIVVDDTEYQIIGIVRDRVNSHFQFNMLLSYNSFDMSENRQWFFFASTTYILLDKNASPQQLESNLDKFLHQDITKIGKFTFDEWIDDGNRFRFYLQPLDEIHLNSRELDDYSIKGNSAFVTNFLYIVIFIIIIAVINFINLSTANSMSRFKEIGIKKLLGASKKGLAWQFLAESVILSLIALIISLILVEFLMPEFNNLIESKISIAYLNNVTVLPSLILFSVIIGVLSGFYPALILVSIKPMRIKSNKTAGNKAEKNLRNALVIFQFAVTIILFSSAIIIYKQTNHVQSSKSIGFDKENIIVLNNCRALGNSVQAFKTLIEKSNDVKKVTAVSSLPGKPNEVKAFWPIGTENEQISLVTYVADYDFVDVFGLKIKQGRFFSKDHKSDNSSIVINEAALNELNINDGVGTRFMLSGMEYNSIGVLKNFHYESMHQKIKPMGILLLETDQENACEYIAIKLAENNFNTAISYIQDSWSQFVDNDIFEYSILSSDIKKLYKNERQVGVFIIIFSVIAIFIAAIGLLGMSFYQVSKRTKEIGIRKVLGGTTSSILMLLYKDYLILMIIGSLVAWSFTWFVMNRWLNNFAYKINMPLWAYLIATILATILLVIVISYHTVKAAVRNPVDTLAYE